MFTGRSFKKICFFVDQKFTNETTGFDLALVVSKIKVVEGTKNVPTPKMISQIFMQFLLLNP
jgi:hypothetical protein